jgi:hypothetical protein
MQLRTVALRCSPAANLNLCQFLLLLPTALCIMTFFRAHQHRDGPATSRLNENRRCLIVYGFVSTSWKSNSFPRAEEKLTLGSSSCYRLTTVESTILDFFRWISRARIQGLKLIGWHSSKKKGLYGARQVLKRRR